MRITRGRYGLQWLVDPSVRTDRAHAHEVCAVRRAEEKATAAIERNEWEAFRERPCADEFERTRARIDAVAVRLVWLGAHCSYEEALVRAHRHRHDELFCLKARSWLQ